MPTKNIVPRGEGEGGLGRIDKPWDSIYALDIPYISEHIDSHNSTASSIHIGGISGGAVAAREFETPKRINHVLFKGSEDIEIPLANDDFMTAMDVEYLWNEVWYNNGEQNNLSLVQSSAITAGSNNAVVVSDVNETSSNQTANIIVDDSTNIVGGIGRIYSENSPIQYIDLS